MMVKARWIHDCELPELRRVVEVEVPYKNWLGITKMRKVEKFEYDTRQIKLTCPECGTKWEWSGLAYYSYWMAIYRPEIWKDIEL